MSEHIHTCSYYCERPACVRAQRDELVKRFIENDERRTQAAELEKVKAERDGLLRTIRMSPLVSYEELVERGILMRLSNGSTAAAAREPTDFSGKYFALVLREAKPHD